MGSQWLLPGGSSVSQAPGSRGTTPAARGACARLDTAASPPTFCSISSAHGVSVASLRSTPVGKMPKNWTGRLMGHDHWLQVGEWRGRRDPGGGLQASAQGRRQPWRWAVRLRRCPASQRQPGLLQQYPRASCQGRRRTEEAPGAHLGATHTSALGNRREKGPTKICRSGGNGAGQHLGMRHRRQGQPHQPG